MVVRLAPSAWALVLLLASPAAAIDLTGTWVNTKSASCRQTSSEGTVNESNAFSNLEISQDLGLLSIEFATFPWTGRVIEDAKGIGRGVANWCGSTAVRASFQIASATTFAPGDDGVSGRMTLVYTFVNAAFQLSCKKIQFERTSTADPSPVPCP